MIEIESFHFKFFLFYEKKKERIFSNFLIFEYIYISELDEK
jgi:hypothetical protein